MKGLTEGNQTILELGKASPDSTDSKQVEEPLKENDRFRMLAEKVPDTIWTLSMDLRFTYASPSIMQLTGYTPGEMQNMYLEQLVAHQSYVLAMQVLSDELNKELKEKDNNPDRTIINEVELLRKNGSTIWTEYSATLIKNDQGKIMEILGVSRDITDRKMAALERERLVSELQQALANVKTLRGLLPICANCKKIRDDNGYWNQIESYISEHSDTIFSHGICPDCANKLYPDFYSKKK